MRDGFGEASWPGEDGDDADAAADGSLNHGLDSTFFFLFFYVHFAISDWAYWRNCSNEHLSGWEIL